MSLAASVSALCSSSRRLLNNVYNSSLTCKNLASGRWYPQPESTIPTTTSTSTTIQSTVTENRNNSVQVLRKEDAAPIYYKPRGNGTKGYALVPGKNGEMLANYALFEDSINKCAVPWNSYSLLSSEERDIYMKHLQAVEERKLTYIDPKTKYQVFTISHHLQKGKCCGNGCRHCPYGMVNATDEIRKSRVWNGAYYV